MASDALKHLIACAISAARPQIACADGTHHWISDGGRSCPQDLTDTCSQAVYTCTICGAYDYGERGGPGHHDCQTLCRWKP